jgi:hypothetical protein
VSRSVGKKPNGDDGHRPEPITRRFPEPEKYAKITAGFALELNGKMKETTAGQGVSRAGLVPEPRATGS